MIKQQDFPSVLTGAMCPSHRDGASLAYYCEDPYIGNYAFTGMALSMVNDTNKYKLASSIAKRKARGYTLSPKIVTEDPKNDPHWEQVTFEEILSEYPNTPSELLDEALLNLSRLVGHPSDVVDIDESKIWLIYAFDDNSRDYIIRQFSDLGYISLIKPETHDDPDYPRVTIEARGWERLQELQTEPSGGSDQAFVAMWFSEEMNDYYEKGIKPAIESTKTKCVRIDTQEHNNKICDEIVSEIRKSKYLVADFTGHRGGVYFEAGFAYGLGLPVIWTIRDTDLKNLHFDTRQYNHIKYSTPSELAEKLKRRIEATIK